MASADDAAAKDAAVEDAAVHDVALGTASDAPPEAASTAGYPAAHPSLPRVASFGGPTLGVPNVIPIFFANDALQAKIEAFLMELARSSYWTATTSEYGVGALRVAPSIVVPDPPPSSTTNQQIAAWLAGYLDGTHPQWPAIAPNNIYVVFYLETTTIGSSSEASCTNFGGYHSEGGQGPAAVDAGGAAGGDAGDDAASDAASDGDNAGDAAADGPSAPSGPSFVYAVIARCPNFRNLNGIDEVTAVTSHELVEAVTNPFVRTNPAYWLVDFDHLAWHSGLGGSEVGDMCHAENDAQVHRRLVGNFMVQRTWSNKAAEANEDPCVPPVGDVYFNAAPELAQTVFVQQPNDRLPPRLPTLGERVPIGQSRTIDIHLFSTASTPTWSVRALEIRPTMSAPTTLQFSWDKQTGNNGDMLNLVITRTAPGPSGGTPIALVSTTMTATGDAGVAPYNLWFGLVTD